MNILDKNDLPKRKLPAIPDFAESKESIRTTASTEVTKIIPQKKIISGPPTIQEKSSPKETPSPLEIETKAVEAIGSTGVKDELDWRQYLGLCQTTRGAGTQRELIESFNSIRENHQGLNLNLILMDQCDRDIDKVMVAFQEMNSILKRFKLQKNNLVLVYLYSMKLEFIIDGVIDDYFSYSHPIFRVYPFKAERGRGWCIEFNATFNSTREGHA